MSVWETNLKKLELKRIIREPHNEDIRALERNSVQAAAHNLIASLSSEYCFVYDNEHLGPNLDLCVAFRSSDGDEFTCCCFVLPVTTREQRSWLERWVPPSERGKATLETLVVIGCRSGRLRVLSIAEASEILIISHEAGKPLSAAEACTAVDRHAVADALGIRAVGAHPSREGVFASASGNGVCVWQLLGGHRHVQLIGRVHLERPTALALSPEDALFLARTKPSEIRVWQLRFEESTWTGPAEAPGAESKVLQGRLAELDGGRLLAAVASTVEVVRCGPRGLVVKTSDSLRYLDYEKGTDIWNQSGRGERVIGLRGSGGGCGAIDVALDEDHIGTAVDPGLVCVATDAGVIHVYRLEDALRVASVVVPRLRHQMGSCVFGSRGESLIAAHAQLIYRLQAVSDDAPASEMNR
jgi:hypothetical protein